MIAGLAQAGPVSARGSAVASPPKPITGFAISGTNGAGRINRPGRPCGEAGADGASWHYEYDARTGTGPIGDLPTELGMHLDAHSDLDHPSNQTGGWLAGQQSYITFANQRGTMKLLLSDGGSCANRPATLDPTNVSENGVAWTVQEGAGAYKNATGGGTLNLSAGIAPGADNSWSINGFTGNIAVQNPNLQADVVSTYWGNLGTDYVIRVVTVVLRLTNTGPGETFNAKLTGAASTTPGVALLTPLPQDLRDLHVGESIDVTLRYKLGLLSPCQLVILNCAFNIAAQADMPDALDTHATYTDPASATAPNLPPPL